MRILFTLGLSSVDAISGEDEDKKAEKSVG